MLENRTPYYLNSSNSIELTGKVCSKYFQSRYAMNKHHFKPHKSHIHAFWKIISHPSPMGLILHTTAGKRFSFPKILDGPWWRPAADCMSLSKANCNSRINYSLLQPPRWGKVSELRAVEELYSGLFWNLKCFSNHQCNFFTDMLCTECETTLQFSCAYRTLQDMHLLEHHINYI